MQFYNVKNFLKPILGDRSTSIFLHYLLFIQILQVVLQQVKGIVFYDSPVASCTDLRDDCYLFQNICLHPSYEWYMTNYCRRACGFCNGLPTIGSSRDPINININNNLAPGELIRTSWRDDNRRDRIIEPNSPSRQGPDTSLRSNNPTTYVYYSDR
ncbi:shK domain-like domain-containing protein [Ditylenchus destructor]|uniref:ShK domain-like domain-containing protein n=1 Tax=Ditylenchus destructor TaxID=166010 RepID=A0AAD4RD67_9BILA|nr:shK domain-like domain-containing protein [Ditylenchus destructor]